jgi:hypothetical protein
MSLGLPESTRSSSTTKELLSCRTQLYSIRHLTLTMARYTVAIAIALFETRVPVMVYDRIRPSARATHETESEILEISQ